jgi:hypothetical protein
MIWREESSRHQGYKDCGANGFYTSTDLKTFRSTASGPPYWYQQGAYACQYPATGVCLSLPSNTWITYYFKVHNGTWESSNSTIEGWFATEGKPYVKWLNVSSGFSIGCNGASPCTSEVFNNLTLTPYMTSLSVSASQPAYVWYDELIVSTQPIAAPRSQPAAAGGGDTTPPTTPGTPTVSVISSSQLNLSWTASTDNVGVTGYRVERCQGAGCSSFAEIAQPTGTTHNDTGLGASTLYRYRVRATDAAANLSSYSGIGEGTTAASTNCTHYASPAGGGNGLSQASPFQISNFWGVAGAGKRLCLLDGTYTGANSMIDPPDNVQGASGNPLTVRALNDGKVLIDGQSARVPIKIYTGNHWIVVEGVNARKSNASVVSIAGGATNTIIRRVIGWDAADENYMVFTVSGTAGPTVIEDAAGFGIARKTFSFSEDGNNITCRRCFGRWERSTWQGPKMTFTVAYNSYNNLFENCIGQWSGAQMPSSYVLGCPEGSGYAPCGTTLTGGNVDQPYGIFALDREDASPDSNTRLLGSIAYVLSSDDFRGVAPVRMHSALGLDLAHIVSYITPGTNTSKPAYQFTNGSPTSPSTADHLTGVATTATSTPQSAWTVTNTQYGTTLSGMDSIFNGPNGAAICFRYENGVLTSTPLWPWPMNQRIMEAMTSAGVAVTNVMATLEGIFGTVPSACRWDVASLEPPLNFHKVSP